MVGVCAVATLHGCSIMMVSSTLPDQVRCSRYRTATTIDLLFTGAAGVGVASKLDSSLAWLAMPGVFLASGLLGVVAAVRCRNPEPRAASVTIPPPQAVPPPVLSQPTEPPPPLPPLLRVVRDPQAVPPPASPR